ncbi:hypothetical protein diail_5832, partial [Diaporthe ilicicola]
MTSFPRPREPGPKSPIEDVLDVRHCGAVVLAVSNVLSTATAELTIAQLIDGLPLCSIAMESRAGFIHRNHPLRKHQELCDGVLGKTKTWLADLEVSKLRIENSHHRTAPYLHKYLADNRLTSWISCLFRDTGSLNRTKYLINFIMQQVQLRQSKHSKELDDLGRFKRFRDGEQVMDDSEMMSHAAANVLAGSDTTAATLRALFYYLCRNPEVHEKRLAKIDEAVRNGQLSDPVTFEEAQKLKYFQAVLKESLRMHPAIGLLLERVVPTGGAEIGGVWLPEGPVIGINPWVAARDRAVYGEDA